MNHEKRRNRPHSLKQKKFVEALRTSTTIREAAKKAGYSSGTMANATYRKMLNESGFSPADMEESRRELVWELRDKADYFFKCGDHTAYMRALELYARVIGLYREVSVQVRIDSSDEVILRRYGVCLTPQLIHNDRSHSRIEGYARDSA